MLLNFRGSTGYGEASIQSLPGKIGENDVADCLASLQAAVDAGGGTGRGSGGPAVEAVGNCKVATLRAHICVIALQQLSNRPCCPPTHAPCQPLQALPTRSAWR